MCAAAHAAGTWPTAHAAEIAPRRSAGVQSDQMKPGSGRPSAMLTAVAAGAMRVLRGGAGGVIQRQQFAALPWHELREPVVAFLRKLLVDFVGLDAEHHIHMRRAGQ